ncbi:hypothetical protein D3C87_1705180 [compost metagenome]
MAKPIISLLRGLSPAINASTAMTPAVSPASAICLLEPHKKYGFKDIHEHSAKAGASKGMPRLTNDEYIPDFLEMLS